VSRWLHWVPALAAPELLQRLVMQLAEDLVVPAVRAVEGLARKATSVARCVLLERAARVLCLLEALAMVRGLEPPGLRGVVETAMHVVDALLADERPHLLVLDEAHKMPDDTLEDVRLLTIADFDRQSPFLLLLAGQLALDDRLADPTHHALDQRVTTVARLAPLSPDETTEYLRVRLRAAGVDQPVFEPGAGDAIYDATSGVPRAINNVATAALIVAAARGRRVVTAQDVHDARLDRGRKPQATPQNKR
jgi:type II secretory pathway predicted ATPase ExeA